VSVWVAAASGEAWSGVLPAAVAAVAAVAAWALWRRRGTPWHDALAIVLLLPGLAAGLWLGAGGILLHVHRGEAGRLLLEVGPGLALTGLVTSVVGYHGRHHPGDDARGEVRRG
jgi:hypothetical protein